MMMSVSGRPYRNSWLLPVLLTAVLLAVVWLDGAWPRAFPDIVSVRCAGEALNAGLNPYVNLRDVCGAGTLDFFYPPLVAYISASTVGWLGVSAWMAVFYLLYALGLMVLIVTTVRVLAPKYQNIGGVLLVAGLLALAGGGVCVTAIRSGNVAVPFWSAMIATILYLRDARLAALVIVLGACTKIYLVYLLVIPALMSRDLRLPMLAGAVVFLAYLLQWHFQADLFGSYLGQLRNSSQNQGYAGASSIRLGAWIAAWTGVPSLRFVVVMVISGALLWRSRYLVRQFLSARGCTDIARVRLLALLLLALAVLSPRVTSYDLLLLPPVLAVLGSSPGQRAFLVVGGIAVPWLFRLVLLLVHNGAEGWQPFHLGLAYNTLWEVYLFATWCSVTAYAWRALGSASVETLATES